MVSRQDKQNGGYCGSTEWRVVALERSERKSFGGNVAKATKNKKSEEGRHVGLDFYDLLIEVMYRMRPIARRQVGSGTSCGARPIQLFEGSRRWGCNYAN